jgi:DNA phosphorothioation-dependent restriction protein DptG
MATFDDYEKELGKGVRKLAQQLVDGLEEQALADMNTFLNKSKNDLQRWTKQLAEGKINKEDFSDLVQAQKALAELHELTLTGIGRTELERFRTNLIRLFIDSAMKVYL